MVRKPTKLLYFIKSFMKVKILKRNENAKIPTQAYDRDFCYDLYATSVEEIRPNLYKYGTGISLEIVRDEEIIGRDELPTEINLPILGISQETTTLTRTIKFNFEKSGIKLDIDVRPRSSIYKTGLILCNSVGTVDEDYRGEIFCFFRKVEPDGTIYKIGDAIAQMKIGFTLPVEFVEVDSLNDNVERGNKGFGSSSKN